MADNAAPVELDFKSVQKGSTQQATSLRTFTSYNFERNILVPAAAFRFTAPGVDRSLRTAIRSGDWASLYVVDAAGNRQQIGTGIVDETDTHVTPGNVEYVLTGRDLLAQMVDNSAVDKNNRIQNTENISLRTLLKLLIANTRLSQTEPILMQVPNTTLLFQTNPGETKINALQRYLEFTNCLVWTHPNGRVIVGKPNFTQKPLGKLILSSSSPEQNNVIDGRSRRSANMAIRQIVTQLQTLGQVDASAFTVDNNINDMRNIAGSKGGRSVYRTFSYGQGNDAINQLQQVGNQTGTPQDIGAALSRREIARENMKILDVEMVVRGHLNDAGLVYNVDQVYNVNIADDDVFEDMYVYSCAWELTNEHGMITRLKLCKLYTICADGDAIQRAK